MAINIPILTSFVDKGVNAAEKAFGGLSKSTMIAGAAIAGATVAVAAFAYKSIQKASDFNEAISKNTVVFGAISKEVENFAQTANRSLGIGETAALQAAGTFAMFGKSAGLAGKELSDFSISFVTLAADLASFSNTSVDDAIAAIGSALRGEAEPLRKYNVLLDDMTLKAAATELGIYSGNAALTAQQKVLAAQKVIFDQTSDAQGDFSKTSSGLAAQQKILSATIENIQTNLGQAFLPIFLKAVKFFNDEVSPAFERVAEVIGEKGLVKGMQQALFEMGSFGPGMVNAFKQIAVTSAKAANVLYRFGLVTAAVIAPSITQKISLLSKAFDTLIDVGALEASFDSFSAGIMNMGSASDYSSFAAKKLAEDAEAAAEALKDLPPAGTSDKLKKMADRVKAVASALDKELNKALDDAKDKLKEAQNNFDDFSKSVKEGIKDGFSFGKVLSDAAEQSKTLATAIKESKTAIAEGLNKTLDIATDQLKDAKTAFADFAKTVSNGIKESFSFKQANEGKDGFITGLRDQVKAIKEYNADIQSLLQRGLSQEALKQVLAAGSESGALIARNLLTGAQEDITGPQGVNALVASVMQTANQLGLDTANKFYGEGVSSAQKYFDGIKSQFDQATEAVNAVEAGTNVTSGFLEGLNSQIDGIKTYGDDINTLLQRGISLDALQAVLDAGGESGAAIAHELVLGAQENITGPTGVNALVKSVNDVADRIALAAANQWYGAGVSNAQSYLQGIEAAFAEAQKRLAKKGLTLSDIKGISASFSGALAGPSVTPITPSRPESGGGVPGGGVVINVNGVMSNAATGQAVLDNLVEYSRVYGPLNLAIR